MGYFSGIESATFYNRAKNIPEGTHTLIGKKFTAQPSAKNRMVINFIAEFEVESTTSTEIAPGDTVSAVYVSSNQSFFPNVKYLLAAYLLTCERSENPTISQRQVADKITEEYVEAVIADEGTTFAGYRVKSIGRATTIKTGANAGAVFIAHEWDQAEPAE
jgi:hypothetical protein